MLNFESINLWLKHVSPSIVWKSEKGMTKVINNSSESHFEDMASQTVVSNHHRRTDIDDVVAIVRFGAVHSAAFKCLKGKRLNSQLLIKG